MKNSLTRLLKRLQAFYVLKEEEVAE